MANILIVDDQPANPLAVQAMLRNLGANLVPAASCEEALQHLQNADFAAVILDVRAPTGSGFKTAESIRRQPRLQHLPIIFVASSNDAADRLRDCAIGAVDFLSEPVVPEILRFKVGVFLELFETKRHLADLTEKYGEIMCREHLRILDEEQRRRQRDFTGQGDAQEVLIEKFMDNSPVAAFMQGLESLKDSEARYRRLFEGAKDGILILDATSGRIVDVNPFLCDILEYSKEEILGKELWEIGVFKNIAASKRTFLTLKKQKYVRYEEMPLESKNGRRVEVEFISNAYLVNGKEVIQCNIRDISARKHQEKLLRASENRYRYFIQATGQMEWITPPDGLIEDLPAWRKFTGQNIEEVKGWGWLNAVHPDDRRRTTEIWNKALATKCMYETEFRVRRLDGVYRNFMIRGIPSLADDGSILEWIGVFIDITDRKRAEESLHKYAVQVEANNLSLRAYATALEAATRAKSEFLANMSHELRTPLNAIIGFSEGLLERADRHPLNDHQKDRLGKIHQSGQHLLTLINDVLDIAKIEAGDKQLKIDTFEVGLVAQEVGGLAESLAKKNPAVRFRLDLEAGLPPIVSDRDKIRQILTNLVNNALKFTERGSVILRIRRDADSMLMSVEDTGVGIAAEHLDRVFEKFFQVEQCMPQSIKGTGLGLSICKEFADLLGGAISVRSIVGKGSAFTVSLPLVFHEQEKPQLGNLEKAQFQSNPRLAEGNLPTVLCIENSTANLMLMHDSFGEAGYLVIPAFGGREGLCMAASEHPQVIVLDTMLPWIDSWEVLLDLKSDPATGDIPVIVAGVENEKSLGLSLGADEYLVKPVNRTQLLEAIRRAIRRSEDRAHCLTAGDNEKILHSVDIA